MLAVIFEVYPHGDSKDAYLHAAGQLKPLLESHEGLISIERFESLVEDGKLLSLSFWRDEAAVTAWRNELEHRQAQQQGREQWFRAYRIRVAEVCRDYGFDERGDHRNEAPVDSLEWHAGSEG